MNAGSPGRCCLFPFEVQRYILLINVATSLAFEAVFRDSRLFCFGSQEKCTQSVLTSAVSWGLSLFGLSPHSFDDMCRYENQTPE
jgi:hypothetical protein